MLVKNESARLIVITHDCEEYKLMPAGEAVEMPNAAKKECKFLGLLVDDGSVSIATSPRKQATKEEPKEEQSESE